MLLFILFAMVFVSVLGDIVTSETTVGIINTP